MLLLRESSSLGRLMKVPFLLYAFHVISIIMDLSLAAPWKPYTGLHGIDQDEPMLNELIMDTQLTHNKVEKHNT